MSVNENFNREVKEIRDTDWHIFPDPESDEKPVDNRNLREAGFKIRDSHDAEIETVVLEGVERIDTEDGWVTVQAVDDISDLLRDDDDIFELRTTSQNSRLRLKVRYKEAPTEGEIDVKAVRGVTYN